MIKCCRLGKIPAQGKILVSFTNPGENPGRAGKGFSMRTAHFISDMIGGLLLPLLIIHQFSQPTWWPLSGAREPLVVWFAVYATVVLLAVLVIVPWGLRVLARAMVLRKLGFGGKHGFHTIRAWSDIERDILQRRANEEMKYLAFRCSSLWGRYDLAIGTYRRACRDAENVEAPSAEASAQLLERIRSSERAMRTAKAEARALNRQFIRLRDLLTFVGLGAFETHRAYLAINGAEYTIPYFLLPGGKGYTGQLISRSEVHTVARKQGWDSVMAAG